MANKSISSTQKVQAWLRNWSSPSVYAGLMLLLIDIFYWDGMDLLTPFIFPLIAFAFTAFFACIFVAALLKASRLKVGTLTHRFRFVIFNLAVAGIATFFPFTALRNACDFEINLDKRMRVVELTMAGKLSRPHDYNKTVCALPNGLKYLSRGGGEVIVTDGTHRTDYVDPRTLHVLFYTYRGILEHYSGFEFSADDMAPIDAGEAKEVQRIRKNWYWVAY